jgi:Kef-type K+ transport system membrane component KefB
MDLLNVSAPEGTAWELLTVTLVIIAMPILAERLRLPGMIGLLLGGWLLGPNGLGISDGVTGVLKELGDVGLLYLMFMAGVELDLNVFRRYQRHALAFALLTFAFPMGLGYAAGIALGYSPAGAALLGSLFASHTLVMYPAIRRLGLAANRAVATTVGATVLTDTLALVVLAIVAGSATGDASGPELLGQVVIGLALVALWCFGVLPRLTRWFFTGLGQQRGARYIYVLGAMMSGAVLAEVVGVEAIVGAFFVGLALNRFVPNESTFMERIEFFGSSLFIPMFLVSVGTVIDLAVMADLGTLGLAAVFCACCVGGKLIAATLARPLFRFSWDEVGVVFSLSVPQAAATLAATFIGLQIGLLSVSAVNAVMILIVVSLVLASLAAGRYGPRVPAPPVDLTRIGRSVVVDVTEGEGLDVLAALAARLAEVDGGVVRPVVVTPDGAAADPARAETAEAIITQLGVDVEVEVRRDRSLTDGLVHVAAEHGSLLMSGHVGDGWLPTLLGGGQHELVVAAPVPVALVRVGNGPPARVVLALSAPHVRRPGSATELAAQVAVRLARGGLPLVVVSAAPLPAPVGALLAKAEAEYVVATPSDWLATNAATTDVVVLPGGRNGALGSARASRRASTCGATVMTVADRRSVLAGDASLSGVGLVGLQDGAAGAATPDPA